MVGVSGVLAILSGSMFRSAREMVWKKKFSCSKSIVMVVDTLVVMAVFV